MDRIEEVSAETVETTLRGLLLPVAEQIDTLDELIAQYEGRLAELKAIRSRARKVQQVIDPSTNGSTKRPAVAHGNRVRAEQIDRAKLERLESYVRARPGVDLIANSIEPDLPGISNAKISQLMDVLTERGVIRFDRVIKGGGRAFRLAVE